MDAIQKQLLEAVSGLHEVPAGAYNIRTNGKTEGRQTTENIDIQPREEGDGTVYNDFYIGDDCDVTIVAGCGIHCGTDDGSQHDGIHSFFIGKNSKVKYVEKHYGSGDGNGKRVMNPQTIIEVGEGSYMEMDTAQIKGVDSTERLTKVKLGKGASIKVMERLMTHGEQRAESRFIVDLNGEDSGANISSSLY